MSPKLRLGDIITQLPNSEQSSKGKVKTHKCINREAMETKKGGFKIMLDSFHQTS
jgi:hypothetical protein